MPLGIGTKLGPYEILASIGSGGMGEVFRATDSRLHREVAIKVASAVFSDRFEREAHAVAALNHPNICTLHDVGPNYLVMELVEGETLDERLRCGPLPLAEALGIATQIAEALEAAHEKGIVHRDLKPGNVKIKPDGTVKVLDFGLAKALASPEEASLSNSPTLTVGATQAGVILGTAAYMSPEQARGKPVDRRADIWAFGCVVFEMLTGRVAFEGETLTDVFAAVMKNEPNWGAVPAETPVLVRSLLRRCLQKEPAHRLHDIADARIEIQEAMTTPDGSLQAPPSRRSAPRWTSVLPWALASALSAAVLWLSPHGGDRSTTSSGQLTTRLELALPAGVEPYSGGARSLALSPDGTRVAFVGIVEGNRQIFMRRLDQFEAVRVKGTEGATTVFFSPDSRSLGAVMTPGVLVKVSLDEGLVVSLLRDVDIHTGASWGADDRITFGRNNVLWQVPASGGAAAQLTTLDAGRHELQHAYPAAVASGKAILFSVRTGSSRDAVHIEAMSLADSHRHVVIEPGTNPIYASSGHLLFFRATTLLASPFDEERLTVRGTPVRVIDAVRVNALGSAGAGISNSGSVLYMSGTAGSHLVWVSREGVEQHLIDAARPYAVPSLTRDGRRLVVATDGDIWVADTQRSVITRLTSDSTTGNSFPIWTPDGKRVIFRTSTGLHWVDADGSGRAQPIPDTSVADYPNAVSPDGRSLAFLRIGGDNSGDIYIVSLGGDSKPRPLVNTPAYEGGAQFSPDGRWVAYGSNESGQFQVFIRPFNGPDRKWLVSQSGKYPRWSRNGGELFYRDGHKMMVVDVSVAKDEPFLSPPRMLFEQQYEFGLGQTAANYDVSADGQRFVMVKEQPGSNQLSIVLNWFEELKRLAPLRQ